MGLNWQKGSAGGSRGESCKVHLIAPGTRDLVAFLSGHDDILSHKLHWIKEENKAFPCLEPHCKLCPWPSTVRWYAPVVRYTIPLPHGAANWDPPEPPYRYNPTRWQRCVLEITKSFASIVDQARKGALFHIVKVSPKKQAHATFEHLGELEGIPAGMSFDVSKVVMQMWGLKPSLWE